MPKTVNKEMPASLRQKIAQSQVGSSPTLVPPGIGGTPLPAPQRTKETAPQLDEVMENGDDKDTLRALVARYVIVNATKKESTKIVNGLGVRIKAILTDYGINQFKWDQSTVNYFRTERRSINKGKLLAAGVSIETIEACTDTTASGTLKIGDEEG